MSQNFLTCSHLLLSRSPGTCDRCDYLHFPGKTGRVRTETDESHVISCWSNDRTTFRTQGSHLLTSSQTEGKADLRKHDPNGEIILLGGQLPGHRRKFPQPVSGINLGRIAENSAASPWEMVPQKPTSFLDPASLVLL